jgi:hypothetical protein
MVTDTETLRAQFVEQRLGLLQIGGIEALGEPVADFGEHGAGFRRRSAGSRSLCAGRLDLDAA